MTTAKTEGKKGKRDKELGLLIANLGGLNTASQIIGIHRSDLYALRAGHMPMTDEVVAKILAATGRHVALGVLAPNPVPTYSTVAQRASRDEVAKALAGLTAIYFGGRPWAQMSTTHRELYRRLARDMSEQFTITRLGH
jgi:hypothetical protein